MSANDTEDPGPKGVEIFRLVLIADPNWNLAGLDLAAMPSVERGPLVRCAFAAALARGGAKKLLPPEEQVRTARWLLMDPHREWLTPQRQGSRFASSGILAARYA